MQSDVLLWNVHIWQIIFRRSVYVISANNASDCKIHYHSNRRDCLVCLCTVWGKMAETRQSYIHEALPAVNRIRLKADSHIACRAHAVPMPSPCHAVR